MTFAFRRTCSLLLVVSLLLQLLPATVQAQACDPINVLNQAYAELEEARNILCSGGYWAIQSANLPLDRAKRLVGGHPFANCYSGLASDLHRGIQKAKTQVLWNDADDAVEIINRLLRTVERALNHPEGYANRGRHSGSGGWWTVPVIGGIGALLFGFGRSINWGQVSTGVGTNVRPIFGNSNPILVR